MSTKFEINPGFIQMIQQSQFGGNAIEDSNTQLVNFTELCSTIKMNGVMMILLSLSYFHSHFVTRQRYD